MSDDNLRGDAERGAQAERLVNDPLLSAAFADLKKTYIEAWECSKVRDSESRERLWQAVQIVGLVQSQLASWLADGRVAKTEIDQLERLGERKKIFGVV
jgi:hypothetical protein